MNDVTQLEPIGDKIIIERLEKTEEERTVGSIILQEDEQNCDYNFARVLAVGKGDYDRNGVFIPMQMSVGQKIVVHRMSGQQFKILGKVYFILRQYDVIGIIHDEDN